MNIRSVIQNKNLDVNVSTTERVLSALAGGWLLYNSLTGSNARLAKAGLGGFLLYRAATGNCPGYSAMGKHTTEDRPQNVNIRTSITVNKPRTEVYAFWRRLEQLPLFMKHLESVTQTSETRSYWKAHIPGVPGAISWDAEIMRDDAGEMISWASLPGAIIHNAGKIEFKDGIDNTTIIDAVISYRAPLGTAGEALARALNPLFEDVVRQDLLNFKYYIESAEIFETQGLPS